MQESIRAGGETQFRLSNPLLGMAIAGLEAQLKAWQAYHVEGTRFVAKRMRADLEHLRALGHCGDVQSTSDCQRAWFRDCQKDYAEEWGRLAATSFALGFGELSNFELLFGRPAKGPAEQEAATPSNEKAKANPGFQAAA